MILHLYNPNLSFLVGLGEEKVGTGLILIPVSPFLN